ncbi:hypothetical protein Barb4_01905 [Bacteroidales bacterium Barb4]|nr:hypothetical protein Barb4_01905 [Bacteroidales bacterium Barb4]
MSQLIGCGTQPFLSQRKNGIHSLYMVVINRESPVATLRREIFLLASFLLLSEQAQYIIKVTISNFTVEKVAMQMPRRGKRFSPTCSVAECGARNDTARGILKG